MKFFIIVYLIGGVTEITCTFNQDFFIYESRQINLNNSKVVVPNFFIKKKVIDFKKGKESRQHYGDNTLKVVDFEIPKIMGWSAGLKEVISIKEFPVSVETKRLNIDCIKRVTKTKSKLFSDAETTNDVRSKVELIGSINSIFEYLPDSNYINLLSQIHDRDGYFCFESYASYSDGQKVMLSEITDFKEVKINKKELETILKIK